MDNKTIERGISTLEMLGADLEFIKKEIPPDSTRENFKQRQELILASFYIEHAEECLRKILKLEGGSDEQKI